MLSVKLYIDNNYLALTRMLGKWFRYNGVDNQDVEDIIHNTLLYALKNASRYKPELGTIERWLIFYAGFMLHKYWNKRSRKPLSLDVMIENHAKFGSIDERIEDIPDIIDLTGKDRRHQAYFLSCQGFSQAEIAKSMNITREGVRYLLKNAESIIYGCPKTTTTQTRN